MANADNKFTKPPLLVNYLLFVITLCIAIKLITPVTERPVPGSAKRIQAVADVKQIVVGLKAYKQTYDTLPSGDHAQIISSLRGDNPQKIIFCSINYATDFKSPKDGLANGLMYDPYSSPYHIDLSDPSNPKVYSFGPNRRDDGDAPQSDDIADR